MKHMDQEIENIFPQNKLNEFIIEKLKEVVQLKNNVKLDNIQQREEKKCNIINTHYLLFFKIYTQGVFVNRKY